MTITKDQFENIAACFDNTDQVAEVVDRRGATGKLCLGIVCDNPMGALLEAISYFASQYAETGEDVADFIQQLGSPQIEPRGPHHMMYFPNVAWYDT